MIDKAHGSGADSADPFAGREHVTEAEIRLVNRLASDLVGEMLEGRWTAARYREDPSPENASGFIRSLFEIERALVKLQGARTRYTDEAFAAANHSPVKIATCAMASACLAVIHEGLSIGSVALAVAHARRGVVLAGEYLSPPLSSVEADLPRFIALALDVFEREFPSDEQLSDVVAALEQELAKAIRNLPAEPQSNGATRPETSNAAKRTQGRKRGPKRKDAELYEVVKREWDTGNYRSFRDMAERSVDVQRCFRKEPEDTRISTVLTKVRLALTKYRRERSIEANKADATTN